MHELKKVVSVVVFTAAAITASIAWIDDRPNSTTWLFRTIPIAIAIGAIGVFLWLHRRRDLAPDLLAQQVGRYFERNGFCFNFLPTEGDGKCLFLLFFQNRYEKPCTAKIAVRPVTFRGAHETLVFMNVQCPGAAFGVCTKAIGVPAKLQGKKVSFDVGADVDYPEGQGSMLRFRDGILLRRNAQFVDAFARTTSILALLGGMILFHIPARAKYRLPDKVAAELATPLCEQLEILWKPGDNLPEPTLTRSSGRNTAS